MTPRAITSIAIIFSLPLALPATIPHAHFVVPACDLPRNQPNICGRSRRSVTSRLRLPSKPAARPYFAATPLRGRRKPNLHSAR
jgi:hypothetical protein